MKLNTLRPGEIDVICDIPDNKKLIRIGTLGYGSCFIHAIMNTKSEYRKLQQKEKKIIVENERKKLYRNFTMVEYMKIRMNIDKEFMSEIPTYNEAKDILKDPAEYLDDFFISYFSNYFDININIYIITSDSLIRIDNYKNEINENRKSIMVLFNDEHYETLAVKGQIVEYTFGNNEIIEFIEFIDY